MHESRAAEITQLLRDWGGGDGQALQRLMPLVHAELRQAARRRMASERRGHTLQPTALVNELYLRLARVQTFAWTDRTHFFAVCATLMRHILIDAARARQLPKRGGGAVHVPLGDAPDVSAERGVSWEALNDAIEALARWDARKARVIDLRFFAGFGVEETAEILQVSPETVKRDWRLAKAWILRELNTAVPHDL